MCSSLRLIRTSARLLNCRNHLLPSSVSSSFPSTAPQTGMGKIFSRTKTEKCNNGAAANPGQSTQENEFLRMTEEEWKKKLTTEQYKVLRQKGTEKPFTGAFVNKKDNGVYVCGACGAPLFDSSTKFDSGSGWPSFFEHLKQNGSDAVIMKVDRTLGMIRTEVLCAQCHSHLGHVFDDGPTSTGQRYCINSCALNFESNDRKNPGTS